MEARIASKSMAPHLPNLQACARYMRSPTPRSGARAFCSARREALPRSPPSSRTPPPTAHRVSRAWPTKPLSTTSSTRTARHRHYGRRETDECRRPLRGSLPAWQRSQHSLCASKARDEGSWEATLLSRSLSASSSLNAARSSPGNPGWTHRLSPLRLSPHRRGCLSTHPLAIHLPLLTSSSLRRAGGW